MKLRHTIVNYMASLAVAGALVQPAGVHAAPFTSGNLVINRVGTGAAATTSASTAVDLVEYTTAGTATGNVVSVPGATVRNATDGLTDSGSASSNGHLNLSVDGQYLLFMGYAEPVGTASINGVASVNRNVARVNNAGTVQIRAGLTDAFASNNPRAAASTNGNLFWLAGANGVRYLADTSATPSTSTAITTTGSTRAMVLGTDASNNSFLFQTLQTAGSFFPSSLPTTTATATALGITLTDAGALIALDRSPSVNATGLGGLDTVYVADGSATAATGTAVLRKLEWNGTAWVAMGTATMAGSGTKLFGITGRVQSGNVEIYATTFLNTAGGNQLVTITDTTGFGGTLSGTMTVLATAPANRPFRGVAFAPVSAATPLITGTATATAFTTTYGTASAAQTFPVSGSNLTADITATAPTGFEVASDGATYGATATFTQSGGIASGTLSVRLKATAPVTGTYSSKSIGLTSGAATASITTAASGNSVTAKALTIIANNVTKSLNSTLTGGAGSTAFTSSGLVSPETIGSVTITYGSGAAAADPAGTYTGSVVASAATGGTFTATNYSISYTAGDITVNPAVALTITGLAADNKPYDRNTTATLTGTASLVGVLPADAGNVTLSGTPVATFATATAGNGKAVTVTGYTLSGSTAGGYTLSQPTGLTANITQVALTVSGAAVTSKVFDGSTNATITGTLTGVISPDVVTFNGTGTFASSAVANGIAVTSTSTIGGASAGNYSLTQPIGLTGNITPVTTIELSRYVRIGRYDLPEPTRTTPPANNLLAQEASGVAYNWDSNTLFVVGDGGTSVTEVTKTGALVSTMTLATGGSPQGTEFYDTEGITYIGGGQFVMTEERDRQAVKFTYVAGGTLTRGAAQTMKLGTTIGNIGLEGISYDPQTSGFLFAKEMDPQGLFQTTIDFTAGTASNGSPTTVNSTNLFSPALASLADMSDVFAFSNLPAMTGQAQAGNILILSQESGLIRNIDRAGNIASTLTLVSDVGNPLTIQNQTHEGVTMDRDGVIYVVSENGGGDIDHPQLWVYAPSNATNTAPTAITLATSSSTIPENTSTAAAVQMTNTTVTDADGIGVNTLSVSGADAASFEIIGTALYLKAGTVLNGTTKPTYSVTVNVDDTSVGSTPDATATFTLNVTPVTSGASALRITEVAPWSSGNSAIAADWFELTNTGATALDITGWKMNDSAASFGSAGPLTGITSIGAGESVIFVDGSAKPPVFTAHWFGASAPPGFQIGYYGGPGLSSGGDSVTIYDAGGTLRCRVDFGTSTPAPGPYRTFDNTAGLNNALITTLSTLGANGAFTPFATTNEVGSPGAATLGSTPLVSITATDAAAAEAGTDPGTFRISRTGSTTSAMNVLFSIATGSGQATSGDYTPTLASPAVILAGQSFVDVTITPVDDSTVEGVETVTLTLGDTGSYDVGSPASATITITDNDVNLPPTAVALANTITILSESASTAADVRVADINVTDDGNGTNTLSVSGADAASFTITGTSLYLKAGATLSFATKPSYSVTVNVDDTTVGTTPDVTTNFNLAIAQAVAPGALVITEVHSSGSSATYAADWFELQNVGATDLTITGWKMDDNSNGIPSTTQVALRGLTVIPAGKSAVFFEGLADASTDATILANFSTAWFGSATPPAGVLIGSYGGAGVGMSGTADALNIFDAAGNRITGVAFGLATVGTSFDNKTAALGSSTLPLPTISTLSVIGTNGAFRSAANTETGSPGFAANSTISFAAATATVSEAAGSVTLAINRTGDTSAANVIVNTANGSGIAGTDYTAVTAQTVSFAVNATSATVSVPLINRPGIRASRTFTATLSAPKFAAVLGATTTATVTITEADSYASMTGPSSSATPYVQPLNGNWQTTSILTVGDGPGGYQMAGIPDGLGAYDNGNGTFTLLMNHELGKTVGVARAHGAIGAFVSEWVINKSTLAVVSGSDLMQQVYNWNATTQASDATTSTIAFSRFCSADLPPVSAFYNAASGLGTQERIFMNGEESTGGGTNGLGYALGHVATGANKGKSYILGKFNSQTNGNTNGVTGWGAWENVVASPYPQNKTIVMGPSDGGTAGTPHNNSVAVYVGTKTNTGSEVDKAGLTNGLLYFINVSGQAAEITNATTRATGITSGTTFTLSATAATTFSRPEDGSWDPTNPNVFYFVTTDQRDDVNDTLGAQVGRTRLWRLNFTSITTPELGGTIDLVLTGGTNVPSGNDANMWDNMTVTNDGKIMLQEDVGGAAHNGKVWFYDPLTGSLAKVLKHDVARFGDRTGGVTTPATLPYTNDEETSGVIDVTAMFGGNAATGERTYLMVDQAHYTTGISAANVEGGQLLLIKQAATFLGIASGDVSSTNATVWAGYNKTTTTAVNVQFATDSVFTSPVTLASGTPTAANGWTSKLDVTSLTPGTTYFYRFVETTTGEISGTGKFKTAPTVNSSASLKFAFSGDNDGLMRPYPLASTLAAQNLDFYLNLGDTIYENASNAAGNNGATWLNSPSVTLSNDALNFNGVPRAFIPAGTPFATQAQLKADYEKKYRENFLPVNVGGQNALKDLYAAQGNYTTWDNHELGNRKYIDGGAPAGGSVGGAAGTDMATGRGVDARDNGAGNPLNINDVNSSSSDFMNRATGFTTLRDVFLNWQPIADRGTVNAPSDQRTHGTKQLYAAQQWGRNALFINTDARSYRDLRLKTANASADDTTAPRANNAGRTMFGATQFAWLKQQLLAAQTAGVTWKFVSVSDPIDQLGPIGGALSGVTAATMLPYSGNVSYGPVAADGGKSFIGGYRAERNALLKYIADNRITNVVFLATDDHQNRINEITYSPTNTENQASYVKVPYCFSIVTGPLGATGPDLFVNHGFSSVKGAADLLAGAQATAGVEPLGLIGYPGLKNLVREGDATAGTSPQPADFYSPDSFNYTVLDVSTDGKTLTVTNKAINSWAQNAALEYNASTNPVRNVFSFQIDAPSAIDLWRLTNLGTTDNTGDNSPTGDFDHDGIINLLEFAFGTNPNSAGSGSSDLQYPGTFAGGGTLVTPGQPITLFESVVSGVDFRALFTRRKDFASSGLTFTPEFSADLITWVAFPITPSNPVTVLADDGVNQTVSVPYPQFVGGKKARFFRITVSIAP